MIDTSLLRLINLTYEGKELEAYLAAWDLWPTLKTDCPATRIKKEHQRKEYAKLYLNSLSKK